MRFSSMEEFNVWLSLNQKNNFAGGSQGECYKIGDKVYKIFNQFIDDGYYYSEYSEEDIMMFSSIKNNTYIWPIDVIYAGDMVVGYIMDFVNAKSLYKINPLLINLNLFEKNINKVNKDIKTISDNGVLSYDVCYNTMYGRNGFKIIDTVEYSKSNLNNRELYITNNINFSYELKMFLVDGYFDKIIHDCALLNEMYNDDNVNILEFLKVFRDRLSEIEGHEILKLGDAKKINLVKKRVIPKYIRIFN